MPCVPGAPAEVVSALEVLSAEESEDGDEDDDFDAPFVVAMSPPATRTPGFTDQRPDCDDVSAVKEVSKARAP